MKLIEKFNDINEANALVELFECNGIPSYVNENEYRGVYVPSSIDVWIHINSQYHDAIKLTKDEHYIVNDKVDIIEFYKTINSKANYDILTQYKTKFILYGLAFIIIVVVFIYFVLNAKT